MPATAQELVTLAVNGEAAPFATKVHDILAAKIHDTLEARKVMVAQQIFGKKAVADAVASVGTADEPQIAPEANTTVAPVANTEVQPEAGAAA